MRYLQNSAPVHTDAFAKATVRECGITELNHPPYNPDFRPSDSSFKPEIGFRKRRINEGSEVISAVYAHNEKKL
jgi:hypothetical protein